MKLSKVFILSVLFSSSQSIKLKEDQLDLQGASVEEIQNLATQQMESKLQNMSQDEIFSLMQNTKKDVTVSSIADAIVKDAQMKAVENAVARSILPYVYPPYPYPAPYGYPLYPLYPLSDVASKVAAISAYNDIVARMEYENAIANIVRPPSDAVTKLISTLKNRNSFADASNIQTQEQGVPVLINPVLLPNEMANADLGQRNYIIGGVDGYNLVLQKDQIQDQENVVLYVNGKQVKIPSDY